MFQRLLLPLDGSERASQAMPVAACLARRASPQCDQPDGSGHFLVLVHVSRGTVPVEEEERAEIGSPPAASPGQGAVRERRDLPLVL
jgi:hypothetical protein